MGEKYSRKGLLGGWMDTVLTEVTLHPNLLVFSVWHCWPLLPLWPSFGFLQGLNTSFLATRHSLSYSQRLSTMFSLNHYCGSLPGLQTPLGWFNQCHFSSKIRYLLITYKGRISMQNFLPNPELLHQIVYWTPLFTVKQIQPTEDIIF